MYLPTYKLDFYYKLCSLQNDQIVLFGLKSPFYLVSGHQQEGLKTSVLVSSIYATASLVEYFSDH